MPLEENKRVYNAMYDTFKTADAHSIGVLNMLNEVYPALAKKIFDNRRLLGKLIQTNLNPMDVLEYPMCSACEGLAFPHDDVWRKGKLHKSGMCDCGRLTIDPIPFREWLYMELKRKAPEGFVENLQYVVDGIGLRMMRKSIVNLQHELEKRNGTRNEQMGLYMPDGSLRPVDPDLKPKKKVKNKNVVLLNQDEAENRFKDLNIIQSGDMEDV